MRYILTAIVAMTAATVCQARTLYVDANGTGDYPTIQAAVNDSNTGDVIILLPGTYTGLGNRDIDSNGKSITVQSTDPCDPAIVAATVINCQETGRGFKFAKGESSLLAGFTIINGRSPASTFPPPLPPVNEDGDTIYSTNSIPTIFNCVIKECRVSSLIPARSTEAAIYSDNSHIKLIGCTIAENIDIGIYGYNSNAEIIGCTISNNSSGIVFTTGGSPFPVPPPIIRNYVKITDSIITGNTKGIVCGYTNMTINRSTISDNNIPGTSLSTGIAGIAAQYSNVVINDSIISRNISLYYSSSTPQPDAGGVLSSNGTLDMNNCVISDNKSVYGGGITNCQGAATIKNCRITNNTAGGLSGNNLYYIGKGGGIYAYIPTQLVIEGCTIKDNKAEGNPTNTYMTLGGGICSEGSTTAMISIKESSITGNIARQGGGVLTYSPMDINNCLLANNEAEKGGAVYCFSYSSTFVNCTFVGNRAMPVAILGNGVAYNCIFWDDIFSVNELSGVAVSYSNVRFGYPYPGGNNISLDPLFTFENDGHLLPGSPCIDAGTNTGLPYYPPFELSATDLDGNPRVIDGDSDGKATVDMGAFEFNSAVSRLAISDSDFTFSCAKNGPNPEPQVLQIRNCNGGTINWEIVENCSWLSVSPKIGTSSGTPSSVTIALDANQLDIGDYQADMLITSPGAAGSPQTVHITLQVGRLLSVPQNFNTIQKAIDEANNGDWVIVADGIYTGDGNRDIDFRGKAITVCSQNGPKTCIIDCNGTPAEYHQAFVFQTGETSNSILDGFTITNGYSDFGGAIRMNGTPTIKNCVFNKNTSTLQGGAILAETPYSTGMPIGPIVIKQCSFVENSTKDMGGAIYSRWSLKLTDCNFIGNATDIYGYKGGGGIELENYSSTSCSALIEGCKFTGNFARMGGAINAISNTSGNISIMNSTFIGNTATDMVGALNILGKYNTTISNSVLAGNRGRMSGGITLAGPSQITNCTIVGSSSIDSSPSSGGFLGNPASIRNCIITDYGPGIINNNPSAIITFSNVRGGFPGVGNIDIDPGFVKPGYWADPNNPSIILEPNDANAVWVNGNYRLLINSMCIDAGDPNYVPGTSETDLDGNPRVVDGDRYDSAVVDMGAYEYQNTAPVADAGPNQIVYAWIDGIAEVTLDANNSYDADGDTLTYLWKWSIDGNDYETNSVNPTIELPVGQYTFELLVNDGRENSEPNQVVITVIEPIKSTMLVTPRIINNGCFGQQNIMAMLQLPAGISKKQVDAGKKLLLYPGEIKANYQFVTSYYDCRRVERVIIWAYFDSNSLTDAVTGTGWVNLDVVGQLKTGQYFSGSDRVWVIKPPRKPVWCWPGYGWDWGFGGCDKR